MGLLSIRDRVRDLARVPDDIVRRMAGDQDYDCAEFRNIYRAVQQYSKDRPRRRQVLQRTLGAMTYAYPFSTMVSGWDPETFNPVQIQLIPRVQGLQQFNEYFMDDNDWHASYDSATDAPILQFVRGGLAEDFVVWYECPHVFQVDQGIAATPTSQAVAPNPLLDFTGPVNYTIPLLDEEAIAQLVVSMSLEIASNVYVQKSEVNDYQADTVNYKMLAINAAKQSDRALKRYQDAVHQEDEGTTGVNCTLETQAFDQSEWLIHGRGGRWRGML